MKKKTLVRLLVTAVVISTLCGCGSKNETARSKDSGRTSNAAVQDAGDSGSGNSKQYADNADQPDSYSGVAGNEVDYSYNDEAGNDAYDSYGSDQEMAWAEAAYDSVGMANSVEVGLAAPAGKADWYGEEYYDFNTEEYSAIRENSFADVKTSPLSTFSADVDTASYANLRRMIGAGYSAREIPDGAVRLEEMVNYFDYSYKGPKKGEPFGVNAVISDCPWSKDSKLLMMGLQTEEVDFSEAGDSNIVFLIDVSGSMYDEDKLPLLKKAFGMLVENLGEKDRVSIVTYASRNEVVLKGVPGNEQKKIMDALNGLEAGGSTNGGEGIMTAYEIAEKYFIEGGNNRVILATDGDLNVGITSESELKKLISEKKESGVFLSVLGFGWGNYSDTNMETLADWGNGNYSYIDSEKEAKKVLVQELGATMVTVAKDVKFQIEFNPAVVSQYRLIGYENRMMAAEDFENDKKDAGEIGAGHSVTVFYELVLADGDEAESGSDKKLKYQDSMLSDQAVNSDEWLTLSVRYKEPDGEKSKLLEYPIGSGFYTKNPSNDFTFAACVAEFGMLLRDSEYKGDISYDDILGALEDLSGSRYDFDEYKEEFYGMVEEMSRRQEW